MDFRKVLVLRGPNIWATSPVIEAWVDLQGLKHTHSISLPGFNDRLLNWLPTLVERRCLTGEDSDFLDGLREGTDLSHVLERVWLELQCLAGTHVGFSRTRETSELGVFQVVVAYDEEVLARSCLDSARALCMAAVHCRDFDISKEIERLRDLYDEVRLGPPTLAIVAAARARGIPFLRMDVGKPVGKLFPLGHGSRQRRFLATKTDETGTIAEAISQDKELTKSLLRSVGVPVPAGRPVNDAHDAWAAACELGTPVVVKPRDADYGHGVSLNLTTREQVLIAYSAARNRSDNVIVERHSPGAEHRLLVVGNRVVAAVRRDPPHVIGDGRSTITQLVEQVNRDPRRGTDPSKSMWKIPLDSVAVATLNEQGYTLDSTPPDGTRIVLRRSAQRRVGGTNSDVTDQVHPEVAARALDAARVVGLNIAGIDIVAQDIGQPLEKQGGVVLEVNAEPGIQAHLEPSFGTPRPVGEAIVGTLFPEGETGRIPLVAVTGVNGKTTTTRLIAHMLRLAGHRVGMTCTDGIYIDGRRIETGDCAGPKSARAVLLNRRVNAAVLECARGGILREGLGFDRCSVGVVTNIGEGDHLGLGDVNTPEKLAEVKRTIVDVVLPEGAAVLKADDPLVAAMAPFCKGSVIFFARDGSHEIILQHRARGGKAAFVRDGALVLAEAEREQELVPLADVPLTHDGRIGFQVENVLAAAAACWAAQVHSETIRTALTSFQSDMDQVPGRFNIVHVNGATVLVDFGHNPSALEALEEALASFPQPRRAVVFSADGDRRDDAILRQSEIVGRAFDRVILYEEYVRRRGRPDGEIIRLVRRGLATGGRASEVLEAGGELPAIELALENCESDELIVILHDAIDASLAFIRNYLASNTRAREPHESGTIGGALVESVFASAALNHGPF